MDILFPMLFYQYMYKDFDTLPTGAKANNHPNIYIFLYSHGPSCLEIIRIILNEYLRRTDLP